MFRTGNVKKFWNRVKSIKAFGNKTTDIDMVSLMDFFSHRFGYDEIQSDIVADAKVITDSIFQKYEHYHNDSIEISHDDVITYIKRLKCGRCGGSDGILPEHLKYGLSTGIVPILSSILTACVQYSVVPTSFQTGILIPILKKSTLDPTIAKNYHSLHHILQTPGICHT